MFYQEILDFWFEELTPKDWFEKNDALDLKMTERFIIFHSSVLAGELSHWRDDPHGRLAEIIVIDQFSRNIYRDDPKSYLYDPMALVLAQETIRGNHHKHFGPLYKQFLYMPFMHSESKIIHQKALELFSEPGLEEAYPYELQHKKIIDRFGRFPNRNQILGRISTSEEEKFLMENATIFETAIGSWHEEISIH